MVCGNYHYCNVLLYKCNTIYYSDVKCKIKIGTKTGFKISDYDYGIRVKLGLMKI